MGLLRTAYPRFDQKRMLTSLSYWAADTHSLQGGSKIRGDWKLKLYRGRYCAVASINGQTVRRSLRADTKAEAERNFRDFLKSTNIIGETVADIFEAYLADKEFDKGNNSTKYSWKALKPHFGNFRPDQITRDLCREYTRKRLSGGVKNGTIHRDLVMLKAALRWHNPNTSAVFELPKRPPPKERYLTRDEYGALLSKAETPHIKLFIILALATAGRTTALLELEWDQIDFDRKLITLSKGDETTNKRRATVPMTERAKKALEEAYKARETDHVIEYAGNPVRAIIKAFKRACKKAGLDDVTPHVLRHTAAVWMAEAGVPMSEIAQYLGHTSTAVTEKVYARYSPAYLRGAASALE